VKTKIILLFVKKVIYWIKKTVYSRIMNNNFLIKKIMLILKWKGIICYIFNIIKIKWEISVYTNDNPLKNYYYHLIIIIFIFYGIINF